VRPLEDRATHERQADPAPSRPGGAFDLRAVEAPTPLEQLRGFVASTRPATLIVGALAVVVVAALSWTMLRPAPPRAEDVLPMASPSVSTTAVRSGATSPAVTTVSTRVVVHAAGAVVAPGLYELEAGARVADLLRAAGGPTAEADLERLNLAQPVTDGMRVYVPRQGQATIPDLASPEPAGGGSGVGTARAGGPAAPVDLNTATLDQLDELPGIGPATAQAIIDHREAVGRFDSVDELLDVRGIGEAKLATLRPLVRVG
jgi:competence protein ComEA